MKAGINSSTRAATDPAHTVRHEVLHATVQLAGELEVGLVRNLGHMSVRGQILLTTIWHGRQVGVVRHCGAIHANAVVELLQERI